MRQHPLSAAFPEMPEKEFRELIADIETHGLQHPIMIYDGMILDGWHRYRACQELSIQPWTQKLGKDLDPVAYVLSGNLHRRHLTGSQRAVAVVTCHAWAPEGRPGKLDTGCPVSTTAEMAEEAGVHPSTIKQAKRAQEAGLGNAVRDGMATAKQAAEVAKLPEPERQAALEAKPEPKPKPKPAEPAPDVEKLKAEIQDLNDRGLEDASLREGLMKDNEAMRRILDAEVTMEQYYREVKMVQARNLQLERENTRLQRSLLEMTKTASSWKAKFEKAERELKKLKVPA